MTVPAGAGAPGGVASAHGAKMIAPRPPELVMNPERLAAMQPNRLSATRSLMALMTDERWRVELTHNGLDQRGNGAVTYRIDTGRGVLTFAVFSSEPSLVDRTPRIIGQSWDMVGALMEGEADRERIEHTQAEMPKLYAGRAAPGTLVWCRSNRSLRAFDHTVTALAHGRQPDPAVLNGIGYLMRNTGLDGNGTFGTRSFLSYGDQHPLRLPYHAQLLTAYLMREFSFDLCEHLARVAAPDRSVGISAEWRHYLGLGNGSALGLVLFATNHPRLLDRWLRLREDALLAARRHAPPVGSPDYARLADMVRRVATYRDQDPNDYDIFTPSQTVAAELIELLPLVEQLERDGGLYGTPTAYPMEQLRGAVERTATADTAETLDALLTELVPTACDALLPSLVVDENLVGEPAMTVGAFARILRTEYRWALELPIAEESMRHRVWYKSRSSEEPRSGPRWEVPGGFDLAVDVPGDARHLHALLGRYAADTLVGEVLFENPWARAMTERLQALRSAPYAHPHMDMVDADFVPARCIRLVNGALYGLDRTKDYLRRTLRGLIFQGAPPRTELDSSAGTTWWAPPAPGTDGRAVSPTGHVPSV